MGLTVFQVLEPPRMSTITVKPSSRTSSLEKENENIRYQFNSNNNKVEPRAIDSFIFTWTPMSAKSLDLPDHREG